GGNSFSWTSAALLNRPRNHGSYPARAFPAVGEATRTRVHLPSARIAVPRGPRVGSNPAAPTVRECDRRGRRRVRGDGPRDDGGERVQDPDMEEARASASDRATRRWGGGDR